MPRDPARFDLYRLIVAGQRARAALLAPLLDRDLRAGDDAIVLLLGEGTMTQEDIASGIGVPAATVGPGLQRLTERGFVVDAEDSPGHALTPRGERLHAALMESWEREDQKLTGGLRRKHRRGFRKVLRRFLTED